MDIIQLKVLPVSLVDDVPNGRFADSKQIGNLPLAHRPPHGSNLQDLRLGKFGGAVRCSLKFVRSVHSTLPCAIGHVLGLCSKEEVCGIYASRGVTPMANANAMKPIAFWNCSVRQFVGNTMGEKCFAPLPAFANFSVAHVVLCPRPKPAPGGPGGFVHLRPKPVCKRPVFVSHDSPSTKAKAPRSIPSAFAGEARETCGADDSGESGVNSLLRALHRVQRITFSWLRETVNMASETTRIYQYSGNGLRAPHLGSEVACKTSLRDCPGLKKGD